MKKALLTFFLSTLAVIVNAQVGSFIIEEGPGYVPNDNDAQMNPERDGYDKLCALLKVTLSDPKEWQNFFVKPAGFLEVANRLQDPGSGDVWIWLPSGTKSIIITYKGKDSEPIGVDFSPGKVYRMKVNFIGTIHMVENTTITNGYIKFKVVPADAVVYVGKSMDDDNFELLRTDGDGVFSSMSTKDFGRYYYKIKDKKGFYREEAKWFDFNSTNKEIPVSLQQNWGYLTLSINPSNSKVYVDENPVQSLSKIKLNAGRHTVIVSKQNYHQKRLIVTVPADGSEIVENVSLLANFGQISIICEDDKANIYIDEQYKAVGNWTGDLASGTHKLEARRDSAYLSQSISITVYDNKSASFKLKAPVPLNGILDINSTPMQCTVFIDGKNVGTAPWKDICLIGRHVVELRKDGYLPCKQTVEIEHNKTFFLKSSLQKGKLKADVKVSQEAPDCQLFIYKKNGVIVCSSCTEYSDYLEEGEYYAISSRQGCDDGRVDFIVSGESPIFITVPKPKTRYGSICLKTNSSHGEICYRKSGDTTFDNFSPGKNWTEYTLPEGEYEFYAKSSGRYNNTDIKKVNISKDTDRKLELKMKRNPWISEEQTECKMFMDVLYGYAVPTLKNNNMLSEHQFGFNFSYINSHIGFNMSFLKGIKSKFDGSFSIGPLMRFTNDLNDADFQIYVGGGVMLDQNKQLDPIIDVGMRLGFDNIGTYRAWSWWNIYAGCQYSFLSPKLLPMVGVSLFPFSLFAQDWMWNEQTNFASSFMDTQFGYGSEGFRFGFRYSFINTQMGGHISLTYGAAGLGAVAGPVFRLTTDWRKCDLHLYGGAGICYSGDVTPAGDFGIRFGWQSNSGFSLWDFGLECMVNNEGVTPMLSVSIFIPFLVMSCGTGILLI